MCEMFESEGEEHDGEELRRSERLAVSRSDLEGAKIEVGVQVCENYWCRLPFPKFDRGDELKAESRPEKNISVESKEEPRLWIITKCSTRDNHVLKTSRCLHRYGEVLQKVEDISGLIPEEEPDTEEPHSPLWVLESVSSEVRCVLSSNFSKFDWAQANLTFHVRPH